MRLPASDQKYIALLKCGAFERRPAGGWRFGTRPIADSVVDRLVAYGRARRAGDRLELVAERCRR